MSSFTEMPYIYDQTRDKNENLRPENDSDLKMKKMIQAKIDSGAFSDRLRVKLIVDIFYSIQH